MAHPGIGVMINMLSGYREEEVDILRESVGKEIKGLSVSDDALKLSFDTHTLRIYDDGQSCCEYRYMRCDDDLDGFVGATFMGADQRDMQSKVGKYDESKDQQALLVNTSLGTFTVMNYNEHNGYYGGFFLRWTKE